MYSKWQDSSKRNINQIIESVLDYEGKESYDPLTKEKLEYQIEDLAGENQYLQIDNSNIEFRAFDYFYERPILTHAQDELKTDRIAANTGRVIIYSKNNKIYYIINKSGESAKTALRFLSSQEHNKTVTYETEDIPSDMFFWLIKRLRLNQSVLNESKGLEITRILGYRGSGYGDPKQAKINGSGNDVINLISTLTFLLESKELSSLTARMSQDKNTYEIVFNTNGTVDVDLKNYTGDYLLEDERIREPKVILQTMLCVVPLVLQKYKKDSAKEVWTKKVRVDFSDELISFITEEVKNLNTKLD